MKLTQVKVSYANLFSCRLYSVYCNIGEAERHEYELLLCGTGSCQTERRRGLGDGFVEKNEQNKNLLVLITVKRIFLSPIPLHTELLK